MRRPPEKLPRNEELKELEAFIAELEAKLPIERPPWGPELLTLMQEFRTAATCDPVDMRRLPDSHARLSQFLSSPKMKGLSPLFTYADSVVESYEKPVA